MELEFIEQFSIAEFKTKLGITTIEVVKSPKTGAYFMTDGNKPIGASTADPGDKPKVSLVKAGDKQFYLLHKGASNNVVATY